GSRSVGPPPSGGGGAGERPSPPPPMIRSIRVTSSTNMLRSTTTDPDLERFRAYLGLLARLEVSHALRDRVDLSGVVQQTLLEAHQGLSEQPGRLRTDEELAAWLRSILSHNLADVLRKLAARKRDVRREWSLDAALDQSAS